MTVVASAVLCGGLLRGANVPAHPLLLDAALVHHDVVAVGERGLILRSEDQAKTWQAVAAPTRATLTAITFYIDPSWAQTVDFYAPLAGGGKPAHHPASGWIVGHDALILATTDAGRSWAKQYQGENLQDSFLDVLALDAAHVIAVGAYSLFLETTDAGKTWSRRKISADDYHFNRITRGPTGTLYIAGEHGTLLRSTDRGATWIAIPAGYDGSFYGVVPVDAHTLIAHGLRGRVFRSNDDGASWQPIAAPLPALLATAVELSDGTVVFAGQARAFFVSHDGGKTVGAGADRIGSAVARLIELSTGEILALGENGATLLPKPR